MYNYNYYYTSWLAHYGMKHKSGRYAYGSGDRPYRHEFVKKLSVSAAVVGVSVFLARKMLIASGVIKATSSLNASSGLKAIAGASNSLKSFGASAVSAIKGIVGNKALSIAAKDASRLAGGIAGISLIGSRKNSTP